VPRGRDRSRIEVALAALRDALSEAGAPWMVIGGIAVIAHGVQRMTTDIDVVIQGDAVSVKSLINVLRQHDIVPRIEDAAGFAAANLVLLTRHRPTEVDLDLSFGWTAFEHEALAVRASTRYGGVLVPMVRVDELLVFKAMAGRPRDIDDAVTLLTLYPGIDLASVRSRLSMLAQLAEAPELVRGLEMIIRTAAAQQTRRNPSEQVSARGTRAKAVRSPAAVAKTPSALRRGKAKRKRPPSS